MGRLRAKGHAGAGGRLLRLFHSVRRPVRRLFRLHSLGRDHPGRRILAKRDWLFYALGGGVVAAIFLAFLHQSADPDFEVASTGPMLSVIGGGIVGGFFYWLSAGRWAGVGAPLTRY